MTPTALHEEIQQFCTKVKICGSYRRGKPTFDDLDIVVIPRDLTKLSNWVMNRADKVTKYGRTWMQFYIGPQKVDLIVTDKEGWAGCILQWTGPGKFNIVCRKKAKDKGWLLNNKGLWDRRTGACMAYKSELEILAHIGMAHYLSPRKRREYE